MLHQPANYPEQLVRPPFDTLRFLERQPARYRYGEAAPYLRLRATARARAVSSAIQKGSGQAALAPKPVRAGSSPHETMIGVDQGDRGIARGHPLRTASEPCEGHAAATAGGQGGLEPHR